MSFIDKLQNRLKEPLPGLPFQSLMLPGNRLREYPSEATLAAARRAGVCCLLYQKANFWHTALIERTTYKGVHSGQMAFPGGTFEEEDEDLTATALRETEEEVGIDAKKIQVLGKLSPSYIPPSNMYVETMLAYWKGVPQFVKEEKEVASIVEVSLLDLIDPNILKEKEIQVTEDIRIQSPYFDVYGHTVWGATAAMIRELLQILKEIDFKEL